MLENKNKGWIYVIVQLVIIILILVFCYLDFGKIGAKGSPVSILGLSLAVIGFVFVLVSFFSFKQVMTPNPVPLRNSTLTTSGIYRYIRHPMYSSVLLSLLGVTIYAKSIAGLLVWVAGVVFILFKIQFEERSLVEHFPGYTAYKEKTKKLIPFVY